ncbi:MAG TPA: hypothetical protein VGM56_06370 [Byssovorax sp.]|jgi:ABC-type phosphate transport system substrate-binding protein
MRALRILAAAALALALSVMCLTVLADGRARYVVIVHPSNPATRLERAFLEEAFLKKTSRWPDEQVIKPVDLAPDSPVRVAFSEEVVRRSVQAVKVYWQQKIFSGRDVPPPEFDHDDEVIAYVLKHPGAVAYVAADSNLRGAKPVAVQ